MTIRLGYQIPNFTYPGGPEAIFPTVAAQAREAEASGFDTVLVMDHFYQLPGIGDPEEPMLEAYTALGALAGVTEKVQLSTLVTGNTYRNPAMLAKTVTTLDVVSGGRAVLGIGAGWYELEHDQMGYEFGTFTDRFERLGEALQIIEPMLRGERPSLQGKRYTAADTLNEPRVRDTLPIMLGGAGERKTFRFAAQYADHLNIICAPDELPRKLDALAQRCDELGRDRSTLATSYLASVWMAETTDEARALQETQARKLGLDIEQVRASGRQFVGTPDEVAGQLKEKVLDPGVDGIIINMIGNGHVPGVVTMAAEALKPLVA
ncbi:LLM class F420-dependent oxidoreductase [Luteipulveratus halotolerans]|uniref:5,10-methylene tetrahydromethanopterin reductase n=1 Tax=Luteipulveratus halotolerans TaxID=1631356 RepID=A0A0L6CL70_9MICO|nr:LLM class F420-dependent oxidoreductase [Luteipulveratus halotolerans]KNX38278.1 5,10-methylene tetrahydromethanopterin reductase [Luteipulveratus halotolerans]